MANVLVVCRLSHATGASVSENGRSLQGGSQSIERLDGEGQALSGEGEYDPRATGYTLRMTVPGRMLLRHNFCFSISCIQDGPRKSNEKSTTCWRVVDPIYR